eukprot:543771-Prymnesium_polylepis.1
MNPRRCAQLGDDDSAEEEEEGGVIEAVSQQLAPPVLVQQSATLFKRASPRCVSRWPRRPALAALGGPAAV